MRRGDIFDLINDERARQSERWSVHHDWGYGDCSSDQVAPIVKASVLTEECGEVARAVLDLSDTQSLRIELVQVAAIAVAWLESL
jgi:NTP pyrophosphatase (non-canonical NTP hydrolase)